LHTSAKLQGVFVKRHVD